MSSQNLMISGYWLFIGLLLTPWDSWFLWVYDCYDPNNFHQKFGVADIEELKDQKCGVADVERLQEELQFVIIPNVTNETLINAGENGEPMELSFS